MYAQGVWGMRVWEGLALTGRGERLSGTGRIVVVGSRRVVNGAARSTVIIRRRWAVGVIVSVICTWIVIQSVLSV